MDTYRETVPVLTLREALNYDPQTGLFRWRERPVHHFKNDMRWSAASNQKRWNSRYAEHPAFTLMDVNGYLRGVIEKTGLMAHRVAWAVTVGHYPKLSLDHINGIRTDNRLQNLRQANRQQQGWNTRPHVGKSSNFLGVSFRKDRNVWRANIFLNGKQVSIGTFDSEEEAAKARDEVARKHHGEFVRLNFPN